MIARLWLWVLHGLAICFFLNFVGTLCRWFLWKGSSLCGGDRKLRYLSHSRAATSFLEAFWNLLDDWLMMTRVFDPHPFQEVWLGMVPHWTLRGALGICLHSMTTCAKDCENNSSACSFSAFTWGPCCSFFSWIAWWEKWSWTSASCTFQSAPTKHRSECSESSEKWTQPRQAKSNADLKNISLLCKAWLKICSRTSKWWGPANANIPHKWVLQYKGLATGERMSTTSSTTDEETNSVKFNAHKPLVTAKLWYFRTSLPWGIIHSKTEQAKQAFKQAITVLVKPWV